MSIKMRSNYNNRQDVATSADELTRSIKVQTPVSDRTSPQYHTSTNRRSGSRKYFRFFTFRISRTSVMAVLMLAFVLFMCLIASHQSPNHVPPVTSVDFSPFNFDRLTDAGVKWTYDHELDHVTTNKPLIIAHRGFSGAVPEHTVEAYKMAVEYGADVIECDAALTKDLAVVCLHECWMNESTDVASKFAPDRSSRYFIPGSNITIRDYFSIDFTLEELKTLRKVEKRTFRNQDYNGKFKISTLQEMIGVAKSSKRPIGLHVELKDATFFNTNVPMLEKAKKKFEDIVIEILHKEGYSSKRSPCFVQSFHEDSLMYVSSISPLPLVYLMDYPADTSQERLKSISKYAYGIGPDKRHFVRVDDANKTITGRSPDLIQRCRDSNLRIHTYTFRNEFMFLPWDYHQDPYNEMMDFFLLGIDGYFTDFPETAFNFFSLVYHSQKSAACSLEFNLVRLIILFSSIVFNYFF